MVTKEVSKTNMVTLAEEAKMQLFDYLHLVKTAFYIYTEIEENKQVKNQLIKVFKKFKPMLESKRVFKKDIKGLRWYLESINTFDKRRILAEGRKLLNGK